MECDSKNGQGITVQMNGQSNHLRVTMPFSVLQLVSQMNAAQVMHINSSIPSGYTTQMECTRDIDKYIFTFHDVNVTQNEGEYCLLNKHKLEPCLNVNTVNNCNDRGLRPRVVHQVMGYRCALCNCLSFSMDSAAQHAKRQHGNTEDVALAGEVRPELLQSVFYCTLCDQPTRDSYQWQTHMRRRHNILVDRRRKPNADPRLRQRKRLASLKDKSFAAIECVVCRRQMRLTESYYLHIRRAHMNNDEAYARALVHLGEVRTSRRKKVKSVVKDQSSLIVVPDVSASSSSMLHEQVDFSKTCFNCNLCECSFGDEESLEKHCHTHSRDTVTVCLLCKHAFPNQLSFKEHYEKFHLRHFVYHCNSCGRGFWKRTDKLRHRCTPELRMSNLYKAELLKEKVRALLKNWKGPVSVEMSHSEATKLTSTLKTADKVQGKVMCLLCHKIFKSMRYYQLHLKRTHLQIFDFTCATCCLGFWSRHQLLSHRCQHDKRDINLKRQQILASRTRAKLEHMTVTYIVVMDESADYCPPVRSDDIHSLDLTTALDDQHQSAAPASNEFFKEANNAASDTVVVSGDVGLSYITASKDVCIDDGSSPVTDESSVIESSKKHWPMATIQSQGKLICDICLKEIRVQNYHPHMRRVHNIETSTKRPIVWKVCEQCGYQCQDNYKFRRHQMTHDERGTSGIICELCGRLCYERMDYNHHFKMRHLGHFNIQCSACGKGFWKTLALRQHVCLPELRDENIRLQQEKEANALRQRDSVRSTLGLDEYGISVDKNAMYKQLQELKQKDLHQSEILG